MSALLGDSGLAAAADRFAATLNQLHATGLAALEERVGLAGDRGALFDRGIIGERDLVPIAWLEQGLATAKGVVRIEVRNSLGLPVRTGTAFVVSPGVVLTNHHVLPSHTDAGAAVAVVGHQADAAGREHPGQPVPLDPDGLYLSSRPLDFALVALGKAPGVDTAALPPLVVDVKSPPMAQAQLTVVQHPKGQPKQLALGDTRIIGSAAPFLHYTADTEVGSSGSPVMDQQWRVIALHHMGVPKRDDQGQPLSLDGEPWRRSMGLDELCYVANEGVLMSAIHAHLRERMDQLSEATRVRVKAVVDRWQAASGA